MILRNLQYILTLFSEVGVRLGINQEHQAQRIEEVLNSGGNDTWDIDSHHEEKLRDQLAGLDSARNIADMNVPGLRLYPLGGNEKERYAIWFNSNWRMTFEFKNGDAYVVDYEDYH